MYYCGSILENGDDGVPADKKKAKQWYKQAAAAGYDPAAAALSRMK
jgi:TPR repeat protein